MHFPAFLTHQSKANFKRGVASCLETSPALTPWCLVRKPDNLNILPFPSSWLYIAPKSDCSCSVCSLELPYGRAERVWMFPSRKVQNNPWGRIISQVKWLSQLVHCLSSAALSCMSWKLGGFWKLSWEDFNEISHFVSFSGDLLMPRGVGRSMQIRENKVKGERDPIKRSYPDTNLYWKALWRDIQQQDNIQLKSV